jgi:hypothetical protein
MSMELPNIVQVDCTIFLGMQILRLYIPDAKIESTHNNTVWSVNINQLLKAGLTTEDCLTLKELGWYLCTKSNSLACSI